MKTMTVTINITFDDETNIRNSSPVNQSAYPPKSGFNFLSSTTKAHLTDFTVQKIAADRKTALGANVITLPSCELLRRHHVDTWK